MEKLERARRRTKAIAHLYTAITKADGSVSLQERLEAPYYARLSQKILDVNELGQTIRDMIQEEFSILHTASTFHAWSPEQHIDEAMRILRNEAADGDWGAVLSGLQNEHGLESVARIDGYTLVESEMLRQIQRRLRELSEG